MTRRLPTPENRLFMRVGCFPAGTEHAAELSRFGSTKRFVLAPGALGSSRRVVPVMTCPVPSTGVRDRDRRRVASPVDRRSHSLGNVPSRRVGGHPDHRSLLERPSERVARAAVVASSSCLHSRARRRVEREHGQRLLRRDAVLAVDVAVCRRSRVSAYVVSARAVVSRLAGLAS